MASARTISDRMPTACDGRNLWNGKKNPVTLVYTVVERKSAVHPSNGFAPSIPNNTTKPEAIPIRLKMTCTRVIVSIH